MDFTYNLAGSELDQHATTYHRVSSCWRPLVTHLLLIDSAKIQTLKSNMASPFLDKLAPEIRCRIYEYALAFETPLYHVTQLEPFVKKETGVDPKPKPKDPQADSTATSPTTLPTKVNTSLLLTSKKVYLEAIPLFYKHNTINFRTHIQDQKLLNLKPPSPLRSDLSFAENIIIEFSPRQPPSPKNPKTPHPKPTNSVLMAYLDLMIPRPFPRFKSCVFRVKTDDFASPAETLMALALDLRRSGDVTSVTFDRIGSLVAHTTINCTIEARCNRLTDRFDADLTSQTPTGPPVRPGAGRLLQQLTQQELVRQTMWDLKRGLDTGLVRFARGMLRINFHALPGELGGMEVGSNEFWTFCFGALDAAGRGEAAVVG